MGRPQVAAAVLALALAPAAGRAADVPDAPRDAAARPPVPTTAAGSPDASRGVANPVSQPEPAEAPIGVRPGALPLLGLALGGGFPDLATASLMLRPIDAIRFFAGPSWGYVAWGAQGGIVIAPWTGWTTPTLSFEGGMLFGANLSPFVKDSSGTGFSSGVKPLLRRVDYQYVAADLGLELGNPRGLAFVLRLGLSFVTVKANGTTTYTSDNGARVTLSNPAIRATLPSLKLGLQYWF
jgi:hypothetical protein